MTIDHVDHPRGKECVVVAQSGSRKVAFEHGHRRRDRERERRNMILSTKNALNGTRVFTASIEKNTLMLCFSY